MLSVSGGAAGICLISVWLGPYPASNTPPTCRSESFKSRIPHSKEKGHHTVSFFFWRSSRDLNPGNTSMSYEISSHASSTT